MARRLPPNRVRAPALPHCGPMADAPDPAPNARVTDVANRVAPDIKGTSYSSASSVLVIPTLGSLVIKGAVDALEPAADRAARGLVRQDVQPISEYRLDRQMSDGVGVEDVVVRRGDLSRNCRRRRNWRGLILRPPVALGVGDVGRHKHRA